MSRYRKVDPRYWIDERVRALNESEKLIGLYCITAQSNRIGLFNFSPARAAEDLGMAFQTFAKGFKKVCRSLRFAFDKAARVLYVPTWWKYNPPENPNVLKSCLADLDDLPETPLVATFFDNLKYLPASQHQTFREGYAKRMAEPLPHQEQEQEQDQEQEQKQDLDARAGTAPIRNQPSRIPEGFELTAERTLAALDVGLSQPRVMPEFDRFVDYWRAKAGREAVKADWDATWRNWCRRALEIEPSRGTPPPARPRLSPGMETLKLIGEKALAAERDSERNSAAPQGRLVSPADRRTDGPALVRDAGEPGADGRLTGDTGIHSERPGGAADAGDGLSGGVGPPAVSPRGAAAADAGLAGAGAHARRNCAGAENLRPLYEPDPGAQCPLRLTAKRRND